MNDSLVSSRVAIDDDPQAPFRPNQPEEDLLYALIERSIETASEVLENYERLEEDQREVLADREWDVRGLRNNLKTHGGAVLMVLHEPQHIQELKDWIDGRVRRTSLVYCSVAEDALARLVPMLLCQADEVLSLHDEATADGTCKCSLCAAVWGMTFDLFVAVDHLSEIFRLRTGSREDTLARAQKLLEGAPADIAHVDSHHGNLRHQRHREGGLTCEKPPRGRAGSCPISPAARCRRRKAGHWPKARSLILRTISELRRVESVRQWSITDRVTEKKARAILDELWAICDAISCAP